MDQNQIMYEKPNYSNILKTDLNDTTDINDNLNVNENTFCCSFCNKKLVNKFSLLRHMNESCKVKKSVDEEKENIFKLLLEKDKKRDIEISELKKQNELFEKQNKIFEKQNKILMDKIDKLIQNHQNHQKQ